MLNFEVLEDENVVASSSYGCDWMIVDQGRYWSIDGPRLSVEYVRECATKAEAIAACNAAEVEQERLNEIVRQREFVEVSAYEARSGK